MNNKTTSKIIILSVDLTALLTFIVGIGVFMIWKYPENLLSLVYLFLPLWYFLLVRRKISKRINDGNICWCDMTGLEFPNVVLNIIFGFCVFGKILKGLHLFFNGSTFDSILNFHTGIILLCLLFIRIVGRLRDKNNSELSER